MWMGGSMAAAELDALGLGGMKGAAWATRSIGKNCNAVAAVVAGAVTIGAAAAAGRPVRIRPRSTNHLRTRLVFRPCARATADTDAPASRHSAMT